ncbi:MAG: DUF502 domain-containing protein [Bacteroidetes bacterium]|nr:DUF502 domain-containing protein [Bacteroidota bacterium]
MKNGFWKKVIGYFIQGLLIIVPIGITGWVLLKIVKTIGSFFDFSEVLIHPIIDKFILLGISIGIIILLGLLGSSLLFKPLFVVFENAIERVPIIKIIYTSIKDFLSAFVGNKKRFDKPVLVYIDKANNVQMMGFITQKTLATIGIKEERVAVYLPYSYGFMGQLIIVPAENVISIDISSSDAMKFILSGGVSGIDNQAK